MALCATVDELKEELTFGLDLGLADDPMMLRHLTAAQEMVESSLGFKLAAEYGAAPLSPLPAAIKQAVLWLAVDFYEGRGVVEKGNALPAHVENVIQAFREWSF